MSLFPWTLASLDSLAELYHTHFGNDWPKFIETYSGSIVVGSTEELYLIRAIRPSGRQEKQIRLDTVSLHCSCWCLDAGLNSHAVGNSPYHCRDLGSEWELLGSSTCNRNVKHVLRV